MCDAAGFEALRDELGSSRASSLHRGASLDVSYDEQDMIKVRPLIKASSSHFIYVLVMMNDCRILHLLVLCPI